MLETLPRLHTRPTLAALGADAYVVALDYAFPWDRLIADFKFNGRVELAAEDVGVTGKFHAALLPLPSVTILTISVAARSMSSTIEFTRLTR